MPWQTATARGGDARVGGKTLLLSPLPMQKGRENKEKKTWDDLRSTLWNRARSSKIIEEQNAITKSSPHL